MHAKSMSHAKRTQQGLISLFLGMQQEPTLRARAEPCHHMVSICTLPRSSACAVGRRSLQTVKWDGPCLLRRAALAAKEAELAATEAELAAAEERIALVAARSDEAAARLQRDQEALAELQGDAQAAAAAADAADTRSTAGAAATAAEQEALLEQVRDTFPNPNLIPCPCLGGWYATAQTERRCSGAASLRSCASAR